MSPPNTPATTPPGARLELAPIEDAPFTDFGDTPFPGLEDTPSTILDVVSQHVNMGGKDHLSNSMHSSRRFREDDTGKSLPSEAPREGPPQLLFENLHPDRGDCDFFPRLDVLDIPAVSASGPPEPSSPAYNMLLPAAAGELDIDMIDCEGVALTSAALAALGGLRDSYIRSWIGDVQYNKLGGGPEGVNNWAVDEGVVVPAIVSAELVAVGEWYIMDMYEYPLEIDDISTEDEEEGSDWVVINPDEP